RARGWTPQRRLVQTDVGEDPRNASGVEVLTGVACTGEREELTVEGQPGTQHAQRLHRLVGRAWVEGAGGVANREGRCAVGGHGDQVTAVPGLDEAGANRFGNDGGGTFESFHGGHPPTAPSASGPGQTPRL